MSENQVFQNYLISDIEDPNCIKQVTKVLEIRFTCSHCSIFRVEGVLMQSKR